jgi:hypothetical protein
MKHRFKYDTRITASTGGIRIDMTHGAFEVEHTVGPDCDPLEEIETAEFALDRFVSRS